MTAFTLKGLYRLGPKVKEDFLGITYQGEIISTGISISIKEYYKQYCHPSLVEKLQEAVYKTADLNHPNIVRIIDSAYTEDRRFFIIYDTPCETLLSDILKKIGKFSAKELSIILQEAGLALEYAHQKRVIHGAFNPDNILVLGNGKIKIKNFYIDYLLNSFAMTKDRIIINPHYLAPEQLRQESIRKTTDVFALAVLAYNLLSGQTPHPESHSISQLIKSLSRKPENLTIRNPQLEKYWEDIIFKSLEYNYHFRHQSVVEFLGDLRMKKVTLPVDELKKRTALTQPKAQQAKVPMPETTPQDLITRPRIPISTEGVFMQQKQKINRYYQGLNHKQKNIFKWLVLFCFVGTAFSIVYSLYINYFESIPKIEIPIVKNLPVKEATQVLKKEGLRYKVVYTASESPVTPDSVIFTVPEEGRTVKRNRIIKVFVNRGGSLLTIPDLTGKDIKQVESLAASNGISIVVSNKEYSNRYPKGQIISQEPEAGQNIDRKGKDYPVNVKISEGYPVTLQLVDSNEQSAVIKIAMNNLPDWEAQSVVIYLQDKAGRHKHTEKTLQPGEREVLEIVTEPDAVVEVYYFNDLALKQELKSLTNPN